MKEKIEKVKTKKLRSTHAEEFLARVAQSEQKKGLLNTIDRVENITEEEKQEAMIDLKDKNRELSTEKKLNTEKNEKINNIKNKIKELKSAIDNLKKQKTTVKMHRHAPKKTQKLKFPEGFLWGTASSSYQIEGGIVNNWSKWEKSDKRKKEIEKQGEELNDFICGNACDSYNRYDEDFKLAKKMHNNCIRLGIEWARIQPRQDTWNVYAIKHYRKMLETAKKKGLTTFVTLWHWTEPSWFTKLESWEKKKNIKYFLNFVDLVIKEMGANIDYWVILNEPIMKIFGGYLRAYHPPQKRSLILANKVFNNLAIAHKESYKMIHEYFDEAQVGCANMLNYFEPADKWNPLEQAISKTAGWYWNKRFLNSIKKYQDYVGINYYFHDRIAWYPPFRANKNEWVNDNGWEIYPKGMYHVLKLASQYNKPIFITENGLSDKKDKNRIKFIKEHLRYVHRAVEEGVDVQGYMHWSLLDNFEWSYGWKLKFGLHEVNRKTFKRSARPSAEEYGKICKNNEIEL
ncbi:MAG: glycoside hydrolase family 1 protein [Patescibacteria group bacterium]|nr:glycoside hydrolase family 1 protein [Patescibacteria group bacterium]